MSPFNFHAAADMQVFCIQLERSSGEKEHKGQRSNESTLENTAEYSSSVIRQFYFPV